MIWAGSLPTSPSVSRAPLAYLIAFCNVQVDVAVIEAGLGGLTDATNVFSEEQLQLAIITTLGFEHQDALGRTSSPFHFLVLHPNSCSLVSSQLYFRYFSQVDN